MKPEDVEIIRMLVHARSGATVDRDKTYLIESKLGPVARREGFESIGELVQALRVKRDDKLMWAVTDAMTSNETCFFRDRAPFKQFREEMLPALAARRGETPIKVWSAGCSTGQEPYSLAMIVDDERSHLPGMRVEIFASDLSDRCLEKAQAGLYTQFEIQRGLPIRLLVRHFERADEMWALSPRIRQMVRWRKVNLLADFSALGGFDVIFCRNLVGTLEEPTRKALLERLAMALPEDGYLVLGADETVMGLTEALKPAAGRRGLYVRNPGFRVAA